jgi:hypothetical protein
MIETPKFCEYSLEYGADRSLIGHIETRHRQRRTAGDFSEREIGGDDPHTPLT